MDFDSLPAAQFAAAEDKELRFFERVRRLTAHSHVPAR